MEIYGRTIVEAWEKSIKYLLDSDANFVYTQRGERAKELIGLQIIVSHPNIMEQISKRYAFGNLFIDDYCNNIIKSSKGQPSVNTRIIMTNDISQEPNNQIAKVVELISKDLCSRRAIINLWDSKADVTSKHPPCACTIQFMVREGLLDTIAYFRSNDSWMAALPDMIAIQKLSEIISHDTKIPIGKYIHFAASYHIYEPDIVPAMIAFDDYEG